MMAVQGVGSFGNDAAEETTELLRVRRATHKNGDVRETSVTRLRRSSLLLQSTNSVLSSFADDSGSVESVRSGLMVVFFGGIVLGTLMPKNSALPTSWYPTVSSVIGYTYFLSWSVSFYPQVITNSKKKSTVGLSNDFTVINHFGYICYSIYTANLFWNKTIQEEYRQRHRDDSELTVQSNDVAFALHALVLSFVWIVQIYLYNNGTIHLSPWIRFFICGLIMFGAVSLWSIDITGGGGRQGELQSLDVMYVLSMIKVIITITKYIPQAMMNWQRKSTSGWSIWNVTLDVTGGTLSLLQLVLDAYALNDWSGVTGNLAKLGLAFVTILFDIIFLSQHYVWYRAGREQGEDIMD